MSASAVSGSGSIEELHHLHLDGHTSVEDFMDRVFRKSPPVAATSTRPEPLVESEDVSSDLIERASRTIDVLGSRCEALDLELTQARQEIAEQAAIIENFKKLATELKRKSDEIEGRLKSAVARGDAAEGRATSLEEQQKVVTLRAARAEAASCKLQQQVEAAFGKASPIRSVMNAVMLQQAAE